jgi:hypothetical protein
MVHRNVATLSALMMLCFLLLAHYEPQLFLLHFYQALFYLAILVLLFYFEDRWAYAMGIQAPIVWLVLMSEGTGLLGGAFQQMWRFVRGQGITNATGPIAFLITLVGLGLVFVCVQRWRREISGLPMARRTFLVTGAVVAVYYTILITWFWRMFPHS